MHNSLSFALECKDFLIYKGEIMENKAKKISVKAIALLVAVLVILTLLIVSAATDAAGKTVDCPDCETGMVECGD